MKTYTDLKQSEVLAKILAPERADLWYAERYEGHVEPNGEYVVAEEPYYYLSLTKPSESNHSQDTIKDIPAWSLAALLDVLPYTSLHKTWSGWRCDFHDKEGNVCMFGESADNQIDACIDTIIKLHEQKLL